MQRRSFLKGVQVGVPVALAAGTGSGAMSAWSQSMPPVATSRRRENNLPRELACDLLIVGGGFGGCAAALAALRNGCRVIMTEETDWIGGQVTQQAVPMDESPWIEHYGANRSYREFRTAIREYYRRHYPLTPEARATWNLNPGGGGVSAICHEPRVSLAVLYEMFAPYLSSARLTLLTGFKAVEATVNGDRVEAVTVAHAESESRVTVSAAYVLDGTEMGDLLPMTGTEYVTGAESQQETGEPHAPSEAQPQNIQACTWCFAMDYIEGEEHTIAKPAQYDFWRNYVPEMSPAWPGPQLAWEYSHPVTLKPQKRDCNPILESAGKGWGFWLYRRIAYKKNFVPGTYDSDITLVNWPMNDYWLGNLYEVPTEEAQKHWEGAKQLSLSLLYWMQTEAPREDGKTGWPGLRLRGDLCGTEHGLAQYPYIRESRRIKAEFTVLEQHVGTDARMEATGLAKGEVTAERYADSVGIGSYRIDLHPSTGGDNYIDISSLPFQIPLGSLIPVRMENLLPACKNLGVTHITNGCYRLHPVEWGIGEAAGALAARCIQQKKSPREIYKNDKLRKEFQSSLRKQGVETDWPRTRPR